MKNGFHWGTLLIVEDAETCATTLEIIFSSFRGLKILTAGSAERAWELLKSHNDIRALVTDLHMTGMDGFELIERVRANQLYDGLPIVVITGSTDPHISDRLRQRRVNAVFPKPYSPALVREKLEELLGNQMELD